MLGDKHNHMLVMLIIMMLSSFLSTMNVWVDKLSDIRWSLNDLYMGLLMSGWMLTLMGIWYQRLSYIGVGVGFIITALVLIRTQLFINSQQYAYGMIPHHSMAVFMTGKLLQKGRNIPDEMRELGEKIIVNQREEISILKGVQ